MQPMMGRKTELSILENEYQKDSSIVVVTGRRGMGKTRLVREFASDKNALYFLATPVNEHMMMSELNNAVNRFYGLNVKTGSWGETLVRFASYTDNKKILIFDGFQNTSSFGISFLKILREVWDELLSGMNITLILVSSVISQVVPFTEDDDNPLHDAVSRSVVLGPLEFDEIEWDTDYRTAIEMYSVHGGVPGIMNAVAGMDKEKAIGTMMSPDSVCFEDPIRTLENEVRDVPTYLSVMRAIADGNRRITQISESVGVAPTTLNAYLRKLLDNGTLIRTVPSTEYLPERSKSGMYSISDYHTLFWLRFVHPNVSELSMNDRRTADAAIEKGFADHAAEVFADICRKMVQSLTEGIGFVPVLSGRYWNRDTDMDIVAINPAKRRALVAGCFFLNDRKVSRDDLNGLLREARKIPELKGFIVKLGLFSVTGFEDDLMAEKNLLLVDCGKVVGQTLQTTDKNNSSPLI